MELQLLGKSGAPELLLLGGSETLVTLKDRYLLLLPVFGDGETEEERLAALEKVLLSEHAGRIRGVYAAGDLAPLALRLYANRKVRIRSVVAEGCFTVPEELSAPLPGPVWYWFRKKDKAAKKIREALKGIASPLNTLCMKKLPKDMTLADIRPDVAAARLEAVFGGGVSVTRSGLVPDDVDTVWERLTLDPPGAEAVLLADMRPIVCEDDSHVQLIEGSSDKLKSWSHLIRLEKAESGQTRITDQVELEAGKLNGIAATLSELYIKAEQLRRTLTAKRHAL